MTFWGNLKLLSIIASLLYIPTGDIQGVKFLYINAWLSGFSLFIFPQKDLIPVSRGSWLAVTRILLVIDCLILKIAVSVLIAVKWSSLFYFHSSDDLGWTLFGHLYIFFEEMSQMVFLWGFFLPSFCSVNNVLYIFPKQCLSFMLFLDSECLMLMEVKRGDLDPLEFE